MGPVGYGVVMGRKVIGRKVMGRKVMGWLEGRWVMGPVGYGVVMGRKVMGCLWGAEGYGAAPPRPHGRPTRPGAAEPISFPLFLGPQVGAAPPPKPQRDPGGRGAQKDPRPIQTPKGPHKEFNPKRKPTP